MAYGVDAAMDPMQPAGGGAPPHRAAVEPEAPQLQCRHDAVLPRGERGERGDVDVGGGRWALRVSVCDIRTAHPESIAARV